MRRFTLIKLLLLCSLSWISISGPGSQTVEVKPGGEVTLLCSKISTYQIDLIEWFRVVNRSRPSCISYMITEKASFCDGFQDGRFKMSSNVSTVFLNIKLVTLSDSGLYFCGFYNHGRISIADITDLHVQGNNTSDKVDFTTEAVCDEPHDVEDSGCKSNSESDEPHDGVDSECKKELDEITKLTIVILGAMPVVLVMVIIGLVVAIRKLRKANKGEEDPELSQDVASDELNYAAVTFQPKAKRRAMEPNVVYAATR